MAPEEGRNVRNKLITITLAVIFMIKILASSQLYRLPKKMMMLKYVKTVYSNEPYKILIKILCSFRENKACKQCISCVTPENSIMGLVNSVRQAFGQH